MNGANVRTLASLQHAMPPHVHVMDAIYTRAQLTYTRPTSESRTRNPYMCMGFRACASLARHGQLRTHMRFNLYMLNKLVRHCGPNLSIMDKLGRI